MRRTGLPARDLRILDPVLSYPSTILGREKAIVVNLEHIKAIIKVGTYPEQCMNVQTQTNMVSYCSVHKRNQKNQNLKPWLQQQYFKPNVIELAQNQGPKSANGIQTLVVSTYLQNFRASTLEQEAYPALDELTSKISTLNLQHARHIKSRLVAVFGRVQKMYLTDKLVHLGSEEAASKDDNEINNDEFESDNESALFTFSDDDDDSRSNKSSMLTGFKPNVEELEMLLEAYFEQIEGTLNKLSTMREYIDDTEDYINIMLGDKQNQLLQMGVLLSTANLLLNAGIVVVGVFGMNVHIDLFDPLPGEDETNASLTRFLQTTCGTLVGCLVLYFISIFCGKKRGLLE
ncbi:hypothetical protein MKX01_035211 [Papaver californicum]|nr:hypothetical protein MKX01_035211 [Papaver californicum]